ncbi:hypothetical protein HK102_002460, partial [Quaeritorhiza haematococci]
MNLGPPIASSTSLITGTFEPEKTLKTGLLQRFYDMKFLEQFERMDRTNRTEIIKHLLALFEKVDKLLSVSNCISLEIDLTHAMAQVVSEAMTMLQAEFIKLYLVDPDTGDLILRHFDPHMDEKERELLPVGRFPAGTGIAGWCALQDEVLNIRDPLHHERFTPDVDLHDIPENVSPYSILCVPVKAQSGITKGVLQAVNKTGLNHIPKYFNQEDEYLFRALGRQAGTIINNAQMFETMQQTRKRVEVLLETTRSLGSVVELDQLVKMIMEAAKELLSADRCTLFLADETGGKTMLRAHIQGRDSMKEIRLSATSGIAGYVFTSGESVNIPDAYKDSRFNPDVDKQTGYVTRNMLCMAIKNNMGQAIGVAQMINKREGVFSMEDEKILSSFGAQAAVAIEKSYLFKKNETIRSYLENVLSSITSCVLTLSDSLKMMTMNRDWFMNALATTEDFMRENPVDRWIDETQNPHLVHDIRTVSATSQPVYSAEYELKGPGRKTIIVNYQIMPLIVGGNERSGVVLVLENVSSEKRAIMTLGRYMSPALAKQLMEEDGDQLGGKRKKVAILFSDIRSFTTVAESMEPHEVVDLLNHHFGDAVNSIMAEQGILDKYIGDAVMAVFGVPFVSPDDSLHACNAALRMKAALAISNERRIAAGQAPLKIGVGINTGMVLSGNIGSVKRMEFSCIGDAVNLASRVEGLTKFYQVTILITEHTRSEIGDAFWTREIDRVVVTGKSKPVVLYELLGRKPLNGVSTAGAGVTVGGGGGGAGGTTGVGSNGGLLTERESAASNHAETGSEIGGYKSPGSTSTLSSQITTATTPDPHPHEPPLSELPINLQEALDHYAQGLKAYRNRDFEGAIKRFQSAIDVNDDGPSKTMLARCRELMEEPPFEDWDGVYYCNS